MFLPADSGLVHFIDDDDELGDSQGASQLNVLSSLTILFETGLELTTSSGDDESSEIGQSGTHDHVGDVVLVTWCVEDCILFLGGVDDGSTDFDRLSLGLLLI